MLFGVVLAIAIGAFVLYTMFKRPDQFSRPTQFSSTEPPEDDAHRELRYRYEHDEIDLDTYQRLRMELDRRR